MNDPTVCILLATYNGSAYIRQMIDSVLAQDYPNIRLILSDDGSSDGTQSILEDYAVSFPDRVTLYKSGQRFGGAGKHFMHLLEQFHSMPYIMFCDQDDVWHKDKVSKTLEKMYEVEAGESLPAMVHTDLRVVDGEMAEISSSFCAYSNLDGTRLKLNQLLVQNVVTGCTMMVNRSLAELAARGNAGEAMLMHDWWIALLAAACGRTGFLNEATIDYRQHGSNSVGAKNIRSLDYLWNRLHSEKMRKSLGDAAYQAEAFLLCYSDLLKNEDRELVSAFASIQDASVISRDIVFLRHRLLKYGWIRTAAQLLGL